MNELDQKFLNDLKYCVNNYVVFIDTCSFMSDQAEMFLKNIVPLLNESRKKVLFPYKCHQELKKHSNDNTDKERATKAKRALQLFGKYRSYIDVGSSNWEKKGTFADNTFKTVFTMFRDRFNLLLITQDTNLAKEIKDLNNSVAVKGKNCDAKRINKYGFLSSFIFDETTKPQNARADSSWEEIVPPQSASSNASQKKSVKSNYVECIICNQKVDASYTKEKVCQKCLHLPAGKCKKCGKSLDFTNYDKYVKHRPVPPLCKECHNKSKIAAESERKKTPNVTTKSENREAKLKKLRDLAKREIDQLFDCLTSRAKKVLGLVQNIRLMRPKWMDKSLYYAAVSNAKFLDDLQDYISDVKDLKKEIIDCESFSDFTDVIEELESLSNEL